ncbi:MAG: hypothetical protein ACR2N7_10190 [Acidimicrobiia bacterium]
MKRTILALMLVGAMMAMTIPAAVANSENSKSTAGAGTTDCHPGPKSNKNIGGWEAMEISAYMEELIATVPLDHPAYDYIVNVAIPQSAQATWDFCDKNLDGTLCVMRTDPSPYSHLLLDNRPFETK